MTHFKPHFKKGQRQPLGTQDLHDKPRCGATPILNQSEQEFLLMFSIKVPLSKAISLRIELLESLV